MVILRSLAEGTIQTEIAKKHSFPKSKVNYWKNKFLEAKLIRVKTQGKPIFYELTPLGSKFFTRSEKDLPKPVIMEDYAVKFRLLRDDSNIDWVKLGKPKNWRKLGVKIGNCNVEKTSKNIIIHSGRLTGFSPSNLLVEAGQIIGWVKDFLKRQGVEIEKVGMPLHEPIIRFYNAEAEALNKLGTFYTKEGSIDNSDDVPHVEWNVKTAQNYLEMPNRIKRIEENLEKVSDSLLVFAKGMDEHMKLIYSLQEVTKTLKEVVDTKVNKVE